MAILITGGAGYIGSHTAVALLKKNYEVVIIDNLVNSHYSVIEKIQKITGKTIKFYEGSISNKSLLHEIFSKNRIESVLHFAGLKSVAESTRLPLHYYNTNVSATLNLVEAMLKNDVCNFIFSSSATVYGEPDNIPLNESSRVGNTTNPYGTSKLMVEKILQDISCSNQKFRTTILRYFNPVGAHKSGEIGEDPNGTPNNLMPYICQVAIGKRKELFIYGNDYKTKDGTGIRDFIHVMDLAEVHIAALKKCDNGSNYKIFNLGTGKGYSVLDLISAFERVTSVTIPYVITSRRPGDIAECWSDPKKAFLELGWKAMYNLDDMVRDAWNWQKKNPNGYK